MKPSVVVEGLGKKFGLTLKQALRYGLVDSWRRMRGQGKDAALRPGEFWAVRDVDFTLEPGDGLALLGVNGSGKTTLLRILNGVFSPDAGRATLRGRVGALIAAGAGFSPMLTGRENIFVNGSLLGMSQAEIRRRFDEIVAFADLEDFIDAPVRTYSSGMSVRLGFAIAVFASPDVLLVDEVLAVGDLSFQKKCYDHIHSIKAQGCTIIFVSHAVGAVWAVCDKAIVLNKGRSSGVVSVEDGCRLYDHYNMKAASTPTTDVATGGGLGEAGRPDFGVSVAGFAVCNAAGEPTEGLEHRESFSLVIDLEVDRLIEDGIVRVSVDAEIYKCLSILDSYEITGSLLNLAPGRNRVVISISAPPLRPGAYSFTIAVVSRKYSLHLVLVHNIAKVHVKPPMERFLYADLRAVVHLQACLTQEKQPSTPETHQ